MNRIIPTALVATLSVSVAQATTVMTEFETSDGFITGPINGAAAATGAFAPVTVGNLVTFSGGQQQQGFDGPSYNNGPAAYLFVNSGNTTFAGTTGNTITGGANNSDNGGLIQILGQGATSVSFFAADRANGTQSTFDVFGVDGGILQENVIIPSGNVSDNFFSFDALTLGENIGSISFDLPGPASNPPYVLSIDTFSAEVAVPEPSSAFLAGLALSFSFLRRRR